MVESRRTATRVTRGAISLSSSSHFPLMPYSNEDEAGDVAAWPRQAVDKAGADRVGDIREHDRHGAGRLQQCRHGSGCRSARMTSGASATNSAAYLRSGRHRRAPAIVDPHVAADRSSPIPADPAGMPQCGPAHSGSSAATVMSTPMRRIRSRCCARAASGHEPPRRRAA